MGSQIASGNGIDANNIMVPFLQALINGVQKIVISFSNGNVITNLYLDLDHDTWNTTLSYPGFLRDNFFVFYNMGLPLTSRQVPNDSEEPSQGTSGRSSRSSSIGSWNSEENRNDNQEMTFQHYSSPRPVNTQQVSPSLSFSSQSFEWSQSHSYQYNIQRSPRSSDDENYVFL